MQEKRGDGGPTPRIKNPPRCSKYVDGRKYVNKRLDLQQDRLYKGYFPQGIMKFDRNELIDAMETVSDELENALKEITMWREEFMRNDILQKIYSENEMSYAFNILQDFPVGIENIYEFVEKELKCYRETQEKIK